MTPNERAAEHPHSIRTLTGAYNYLDPDADAITLDDIVAGLRIARWSAQTPERREVLAHSLHVHEVACVLTDDPRERFTALMHDAHEAFIGDVPRPLKIALRSVTGRHSPFDDIENRAMRAVADRFGLIYPHPHVVRQADNMVLGWEADLHYGPGTADVFGLPPAEECPAPMFVSVQAMPEMFRGLVRHYEELLGGQKICEFCLESLDTHSPTELASCDADLRAIEARP